MSEWPKLDEALEIINERVEHAVQLAARAYRTADDDDDSGEGGQAIHRYSDFVVKDTFPFAVLGLFLLEYRKSPPTPNDEGSRR